MLDVGFRMSDFGNPRAWKALYTIGNFRNPTSDFRNHLDGGKHFFQIGINR